MRENVKRESYASRMTFHGPPTWPRGVFIRINEQSFVVTVH